VGIDAATGREVPRSYVDWLEKRVRFLEQEMGIGGEVVENSGSETGGGVKRKLSSDPPDDRTEASGESARCEDGKEDKALHLRPDIENLVSQVGLVGVHGTSAPGFLGGTSGISYDRAFFLPSFSPPPFYRGGLAGADTPSSTCIDSPA
jgi:hypothetical protein